ncbi:MAG: carbon-nitrogen hydrolase family protein [Acidobacteria bacterium]|nr:carbon-nitrogen hydrolase family protein [Acidobacteriota bacterium]
MRWPLALVTVSAALAQPALLRQSGFDSAWDIWAPRPEIAPRGYLDPTRSRAKPASLALSGNSNPAVCGGWQRAVSGVEPGRWYRLTAYYRAEGSQYDALQVLARLDWTTTQGRRAGQPDYASRVAPDGAWRRVTLEAPAPEKAAGVSIQLLLLNAPDTTVWWDDITLEAIPAPAPRPVRVAALNLRPDKSASAAASVAAFVAGIEKAVPEKTDIILLPEGITVVGTGKKYLDVAETIPGPTTETLGAVARRRAAWIVAGIYEREGPAVYNTAVLLDRAGRVAGRYRKVYIPREEMEGGITPGRDYPVFRTDFGSIGLMICWDVQYADPARALALRGAEMILMPIWGGNETLAKARAIENHVYLASSGYGFPTLVLGPDGETLAAAPERGQAAVATVDLSKRPYDTWLGELRGRFLKELRLDVNAALAGALR